jgi:glycine cleavage system regulatory protein
MQDKQYLNIAAIFATETETLREIAHLIAHHQCDILDWRLYQHGNRHNLHFLIGGTWAVIAKLEPKLNADSDGANQHDASAEKLLPL